MCMTWIYVGQIGRHCTSKEPLVSWPSTPWTPGSSNVNCTLGSVGSMVAAATDWTPGIGWRGFEILRTTASTRVEEEKEGPTREVFRVRMCLGLNPGST